MVEYQLFWSVPNCFVRVEGFFLAKNRLILKFSNLSVLHKGLLMQDWEFRLGGEGWIQKRTKSFYGWPLSMQIGNRILSLKSLVNWCSNLYFGYLPTYINLGTNYRVGSSKNQIGSDWIFGWESPNFGNLSSNSYITNQNSSVSFDACQNEVKTILKSQLMFHFFNLLSFLWNF